MKFRIKYFSMLCFILLYSYKGITQIANISGVINNYASVISIGSQSVNVSSAAGFTIGDKVLLIQMKGATIDTSNTSLFGTINAYNDAGNYEILVVSSISANTITFSSPFLRTYNVNGIVQLVKIPVYNNVNVVGVLTCAPWNGSVGGVLAFEANGNVTLNANIDVTGKGFLGGAKLFGQLGSCIGNISDFKLPLSSLLSTNKGEGITIIQPSFAKGLGALANGGGAGNDVNGGGAGGGNYGQGGHGGNSKCSSSPVSLCGGYEGKNCIYSNINNKIFLGGGGGAGHENDGLSTAGVSGGGIILIRCLNLIGNNNSIVSNGADNTAIAGNDGQGGGGGGGTILIDACSSSSLTISAKGGFGGIDNYIGASCHGKGGGGGGGIIWTSSPLIYNSVLTGGLPGIFTSGSSPCFNTSNGATMGQVGGTLTGLLIPGTVPFSSATASLSISSTCSNNIAIATASVITTILSPNISYTWTNSSGQIISQTNNTVSLTNSVTNLANGIYTLSIQVNAPCGPMSSQTININCGSNSTIPPCKGVLTGTGMSICNQYSFSITPSQTITPFNYSNQGYACTGLSMPDVSFNILGAGWRVMKNNWNFQSSVAGEISGYTSSGILQTITFSPTNTITPLSYSGSFVQFAINGIATGSLMNQATFSISLNSSQHLSNSYTYCPSSTPSLAISPGVPAQGGPWTYLWQPGGLTGNPINISTQSNTVYTVTASSGSGCLSTTTVSVNVDCPPLPLCSGNLGNPVFLENFGFGSALYGPALPLGVTNYPYYMGVPINGIYCISATGNPSSTNGYVNAPDHTGNLNGYMMVVNADYGPNEAYRRHVTGLCPNTTYVFSSYLANNNDISAITSSCGNSYIFADVKFQIEYPLGTVQNSVTTGNLPIAPTNTAYVWNQYGFAFTTLPGQTSVDVVLINNAPGGCGNDYVVDDISLSPCGPGVALNIVPNQTIFCLGDPVNLQSSYISGSYNNPQYQWQYSNDGGITWINISGATSQNYSITNVSSSQAGTYQLLVAENGNINSAACSIIAGPIAFSVSNGVSISTSTTVCSGNSTTITASGANNYNWSNGATTNSVIVTPSATTVYSVVGSVGSCTSQASSTVNVIPSSTVSVSGNTLICAGQSSSLTASGATTYSWNTGATTSLISVNPNVTTTYTATTAGSLCVTPAQITVSVVPIPIVSAGTNTFLCQGQSGVILSASGANTYTWSNASSLSSSSSTTVLSTPTITTTYTLTGMNSLCINTAVVTVSVNPSPTISAVSFTNTSCGLSNGSIIVTSSPSNNTYAWSSGITSTTNTASSLTSGTYSVTVSNGGCQTTTVVPILTSSPLIITSSTITPSDCNLNNGSITVNDNYVNSNYSWSPNVSLTNTASNLSAGNYALTITNGACSTSSVFVILQLNGPTSLNVTQSDAICESTNGIINIVSVVNGIAPFQYNFNNTGFSSVSTYSDLAQGIYTITVKDAHGCLFTQLFSIDKLMLNLTIDLVTNAPTCDDNDGSYVINKFTSGTPPFFTSFNNGAYSSNLIFDQLGIGTYSLSIRDSNMCETGYVLTLQENGDYTLYIPNTFTPNNNKVNDIWYVKGTCLDGFSCLIFNRWGEKIKELKDIKDGWDGTYKGIPVPDGVYVYVIEAKTQKEVIKKSGHITVFR